MRSMLSLVTLCLLAPAGAAQAAPDSLAQARQLTEWFFAGQMDSVFAHTHAEARQQITEAVLRERLDLVQMRAGAESDLVEERFVRRNGQTQYWRTAWWSGLAEETVTFRLVLVDGMLAGMGINPTSQNPPIDP